MDVFDGIEIMGVIFGWDLFVVVGVWLGVLVNCKEFEYDRGYLLVFESFKICYSYRYWIKWNFR